MTYIYDINPFALKVLEGWGGGGATCTYDKVSGLNLA